MMKFYFLIAICFTNILFSQESFEEDLKYLNRNISDLCLRYGATVWGEGKISEFNEDYKYFDLDQYLLQYLHEHRLFDIDSLLKYFHELYPYIDAEKCIDLKDWQENFADLFHYALNEKDVLNLSVSQIKEKYQKIADEKNKYLFELFKIYSLKNKNEEIEQLLDLLTNENEEFQIMSAKEWIHRNLEKIKYAFRKGNSNILSLWIPSGYEEYLGSIDYLESCGFFDHEDFHQKNRKDKALIILVDLYCKQGQISKAENILYSIKSLDKRILAYKSLMKIYAKTKTPQEILEIHKKYFMGEDSKEKPISNLYWLSKHMFGRIYCPKIFYYFLESCVRNSSIEELQIYIKDIEFLKADYERVENPQYVIYYSDEEDIKEVVPAIKYFVDNEFDRALLVDCDEDSIVEKEIIKESYRSRNWKSFDRIMLDDFSNFHIPIRLMKYHERLLPLFVSFLKTKSEDEIKGFFEERYEKNKSLTLSGLIFLCMAKNL